MKNKVLLPSGQLVIFKIPPARRECHGHAPLDHSDLNHNLRSFYYFYHRRHLKLYWPAGNRPARPKSLFENILLFLSSAPSDMISQTWIHSFSSLSFSTIWVIILCGLGGLTSRNVMISSNWSTEKCTIVIFQNVKIINTLTIDSGPKSSRNSFNSWTIRQYDSLNWRCIKNISESLVAVQFVRHFWFFFFEKSLQW